MIDGEPRTRGADEEENENDLLARVEHHARTIARAPAPG
jgi:hypothetical protein